MIIGITGSICSGKHALARYLKEVHKFELVDLQALFKKKLKKKGLYRSPSKKDSQNQ